MKNLLRQKLDLLKNKLSGVEVDDKEVEDNRTHLEQLEDILNKKSGNAGQPERELYEEEKAKMEEWKKEVEEQDKDLEDIHGAVKQLRIEIKQAGKNLDNVNSSAKKLDKHVVKTNANVVTTNKKLKDLLDKLRKGDKLCMDLVLILILLGLIAVLYGFIKKKTSSD